MTRSYDNPKIVPTLNLVTIRSAIQKVRKLCNLTQINFKERLTPIEPRGGGGASGGTGILSVSVANFR